MNGHVDRGRPRSLALRITLPDLPRGEVGDGPTGEKLARCYWAVRFGVAIGACGVLLGPLCAPVSHGDWWIVSTAVCVSFLAPFLTGYLAPRWSLRYGRVVMASLVWPAGWATLTRPEIQEVLCIELIPAIAVLMLLGCVALLLDFLLCVGALAAAIRGRLPSLRWVFPCLMLVPGLTSAGLWIDLHEPTPLPATRTTRAIEVFGELSLSYPHWDEADVSPESLWAEYRPWIDRADRVCGDQDEPCGPYLHALRNMFAELRNGHTGVTIFDETAYPKILIEPIEGRVVISGMADEPEDGSNGLQIGMEVLAIDGVPVRRALEGVPEWELGYAGAHTREFGRHHYVLRGLPGTEVEILARSGDGPPRKGRFLRYAAYSDPDEFWEEEESPLEGYVTPEGFAVIALEGFDGWDLVDSFDEVLDRMLGKPGLIFDLRYNLGGNSFSVYEIVGRLFDEEVIVGERCHTDWGDSEQNCLERIVDPRPPVYGGPIAVLINENVFSAGDIAAYTLCASGRARCFGQTTAGETDSVIFHELPGGVARISDSSFHPALGGEIHGKGVRPHVLVDWTIADLVEGRDPDLEAARQWLRQVTGR
jgi:C-terminal processing protease CtpA/Prc